MKKLFIMVFFCVNLFALTGGLAQKIIKISDYYNIDPKIVFTVVKIESSFNPYVINVNNLKGIKKTALVKFLKAHGIGFQKYSSSIQVNPATKKNALKTISFLNMLNAKNFDVGLMQINSKNLPTPLEVKLALNPAFNLIKGIKILRNCFDYDNYNVYKTFICYNGSKAYVKKFYSQYIQFFVKK